ncbi:MAG: hypothetical protein V7K18_08620, partial [Nostoc sp.]|uniref:hypothetical protein n=1 Tax=Nostoc sp. TaxID=1180 RepID=UPI002FFB371C
MALAKLAAGIAYLGCRGKAMPAASFANAKSSTQYQEIIPMSKPVGHFTSYILGDGSLLESL